MRKQTLKILLSAYACEPGKGSEPGVGWNWALELARQGHDVTVLTRANNRQTIEPVLREQELPNLQFVYFDLPSWVKWWKKGGRGLYLYYLLWQAGIYFVARRTLPVQSFDVVHHLTFGSFRQASYLGQLGRPFIVGPIGGGDSVPLRLRRAFPLHGRVKEAIRDFSNKLSTLDPSVRQMVRRADIVYCKTQETLEILPRRYSACYKVALEIGIEPHWFAEPIQVPSSPRFVSVGRLLYLKGTHLTLDAFARVLRKREDARLTLIGIGPDEKWLRDQAEALGVNHAIQWLGWQSQEAVRAHCNSALAMVFPSLRDASGNVALEALAAGTPVICLDVGGPATIVPPNAGFCINTHEADAEIVVSRIADAMMALINNNELVASMSSKARQYAQERTWGFAVNAVYHPFFAALPEKSYESVQ